MAGAQPADLAEADDDGAARLGARGIVEEDGVAAEGAGVDAEVEPAGQGTAQLLVEHGFGADHGVALVMADDDRVAGVGQVAMADGDLDAWRRARRPG